MRCGMKLLTSLWIAFSLMTLCGCISRNEAEAVVTADIVAIENKIIDGDLNFGILGGRGSVSNDTIKIGVRFYLADELFLLDIDALHAELAHFCSNENNNKIPIRVRAVTCDTWVTDEGILYFHLNHRRIYYNRIPMGRADKFINYLKYK